ncbi:quinone oxidoreductase family protein [Dactylosporangium sp. CA-092794]|uniref:quinone oxidoreductase family protein n=1 Tax=Dactylosporangium sp. CA-092794 TaxID=3239929 RepID=UPI003D94290E
MRSVTMRAALIREHGGPEVLRIEEVPDPVPAAGEVLVRLRGAALNYHDVLLRRSGLGMRLPLVMGVDGAGVRCDTGEAVIIQPSLDWGPDPAAPGPGWSILGDRRQGTYAELIALPEENLRPKPAGWTWAEAAALPTAGLTVYRGLFTRGGLKAGETIVMLGTGGGIATFVIAMAAAAGARVLVTSSSADKIARATRELGAAGGAVYDDPGWTDRIRALTPAGAGADLVIDTVGRDTAASLRCVRPGGRLVVFGAPVGAVASFDLREFYFSQRSIVATTLGTGREFDELLGWLDGNPWRPVIDSTFAFGDVVAAHERMESGQHFGKIILTFD